MKPIVVISGGSDGLGKEIGRILAPDYQVIILSPTEEKLKAAATELGVDYQVCDVSDWTAVDTAVKNILDKYHQIDILINNAGIWIDGDLATNNPTQIKRTLDVNTLGTILLTRAVIPSMVSRQSGRIINIISQGGLVSKAGRSVYYASKWAITGFTKSLELELIPDKVAVMGIYPAMIKTKMYEKAGENKDVSKGLDPVDIAKTIKFILSFAPNISFPELGIKNIEYI